VFWDLKNDHFVADELLSVPKIQFENCPIFDGVMTKTWSQ